MATYLHLLQCAHHGTLQALDEAGIIDGLDMTVEAALMKLAYVTGKEDKEDKNKERSTEEKRQVR